MPASVLVSSLASVEIAEFVDEDDAIEADGAEVLVDDEAPDALISVAVLLLVDPALIPSTVVPISPKRMLLKTTVASACSETTVSGSPLVLAHVPRATPAFDASAVTG